MNIRRITQKDAESVMRIFEQSRAFMRDNGNREQWNTDYPGLEEIEAGIEKDGYVVVEDEKVVGVFVLSDYDEAYEKIKGKWLDDEPYGVIHTMASGGARSGAGQFILDWCLDKKENIRLDTHKDNSPMRNLLAKNGYQYCGVVTLEGRGERLAFQKTGTGS